jgi:hypothetical protein
MTDHVCPVCNADFVSESSLEEHCWDAHGACHYCGTEFDNQDTLHTHWLAVHEDSLSKKARARAISEVGELTFRDRLEQQGPASAVTNASLSRRQVLLGGVLGLSMFVFSRNIALLQQIVLNSNLPWVNYPTLLRSGR